ncbi:PREDICTED: LOC110773565, partial [Prunus dulcis]
EKQKAAVEDTLRRLYGFWVKRAAEHGSTANLVEFLHEGPENDALELEEVELAP